MSEFKSTFMTLDLLHRAMTNHDMPLNAQGVNNVRIDLSTIVQRLEAAEAELARREEAAGEPVAYFVRRENEPYNTGTKIDAKDKDSFPWTGCVYQPLFATAQPSALPPEMMNADAPDHYSSEETFAWVSGANWMRDQVKSLGCKAIKLPDSFYSSLEKAGGLKGVIASLNAQGFSVEGE